MPDFAVDLQNYANSFQHGFLKHWKATEIAVLVERENSPFKDRIRLGALIEDSLVMEGFRVADCEQIADYVFERITK